MRGGTLKRIRMTMRTLVLIILAGVLVAAYTLNAKRGGRLDGFGTSPQTIGQLGSYHLIRDLTVAEKDGFFRVALRTEQNPATASGASAHSAPYVEVVPETKDDPVQFDGGDRLMPELGDYRLTVSLSDTRTVDLSGESVKPVFRGPERQVVNRGPITEVRLHYPPDDSLLQVLVGLSREAEFRLHTNPGDPGVVWIDIAK